MAKVWKPNSKQGHSTVEDARELRARFKVAHGDGMDALRRKDYDALSDAIQREQAILNEQEALIEEQRAAIQARKQRLSSVRTGKPPRQ